MTDLSATPIFIPTAGVAWPFAPNATNRAAWEQVLATPGARMVTFDGGKLATATETVDIVMEYLADGSAEAHGVFRIDPVDMLHERQVRAMLRDLTANRQASVFARKAGVSRNAVNQVTQLNRRPSTKMLDAMGLQRIRRTEIYVTKVAGSTEFDAMASFDSDARGGNKYKAAA